MKQFKRDEKQNSNKLNLDQYYTSEEVAEYCLSIARKILKNEKITEVIEPSAGNGVFSKKIKNCIAYDIQPQDESIIQQDFLELSLEYKEGRLFIGNPPFGDRFNIGRQFIKKGLSCGDFVAFILPISQYKNKYLFNDCELLYTEDLGKQKYTDRDIHCCFNIYKRNVGIINDFKLKDVYLYDHIKNKNPKRNKPYKDNNYDFRICAWGASTGRILEESENYVKEIGFYVKEPWKEIVYDKIKNNNLQEYYAMTSTPVLGLWHVYNFLKTEIDGIN